MPGQGRFTYEGWYKLYCNPNDGIYLISWIHSARFSHPLQNSVEIIMPMVSGGMNPHSNRHLLPASYRTPLDHLTGQQHERSKCHNIVPLYITRKLSPLEHEVLEDHVHHPKLLTVCSQSLAKAAACTIYDSSNERYSQVFARSPILCQRCWDALSFCRNSSSKDALLTAECSISQLADPLLSQLTT